MSKSVQLIYLFYQSLVVYDENGFKSNHLYFGITQNWSPYKLLECYGMAALYLYIILFTIAVSCIVKMKLVICNFSILNLMKFS